MSLASEANKIEAPGTHVLVVLDTSGDTRTAWALDDPETMAEAERIFNRLKSDGYTAFAVGSGSADGGEVIKTFDKETTKVIMSPALHGG